MLVSTNVLLTYWGIAMISISWLLYQNSGFKYGIADFLKSPLNRKMLGSLMLLFGVIQMISFDDWNDKNELILSIISCAMILKSSLLLTTSWAYDSFVKFIESKYFKVLLFLAFALGGLLILISNNLATV